MSESDESTLSNQADLKILKPMVQRSQQTIYINPGSCIQISVSISGQSVTVQSPEHDLHRPLYRIPGPRHGSFVCPSPVDIISYYRPLRGTRSNAENQTNYSLCQRSSWKTWQRDIRPTKKDICRDARGISTCRFAADSHSPDMRTKVTQGFPGW